MRCRTARHLIVQQSDRPSSSREDEALSSHLETCDHCRRLAREMANTLSALDVDAALLASAQMSPGLTQRLHASLLEEARARAAAPVAALDAVLARCVQARPGPSAWVARPAAVLVVVLAVASFTASVLVSVPGVPESQCPTGHLASFSAQSSPDGRVYAAITSQNAVGRRDMRGALQ